VRPLIVPVVLMPNNGPILEIKMDPDTPPKLSKIKSILINLLFSATIGVMAWGYLSPNINTKNYHDTDN
jgi:hypothetical protein